MGRPRDASSFFRRFMKRPSREVDLTSVDSTGPLLKILPAVILFAISGCGDGTRGGSTPARDGTAAPPAELFAALDGKDFDADPGLVTFSCSMTGGWDTLVRPPLGKGYVHALPFHPGARGLGRFTLAKLEIPKRPKGPLSANAGPFWDLEPGERLDLLAQAKMRHLTLTMEKGKNVRKFDLPPDAVRTEPVPSLLRIRLRGLPSANRRPRLRIVLSGEEIFRTEVSHARPYEYVVPLPRKAEPSTLVLGCDGVEIAPPVFDDRSPPEASLLVYSATIEKPPRLAVLAPPKRLDEMGRILEQEACRFAWTELPGRPLLEVEQAHMAPTEDRADRCDWCREAGRGPVTLSKVTRPGLMLGPNSHATFPAVFRPGGRVECFVGLPPVEGTLGFLRIEAETGAGETETLVTRALAHPLLQREEAWEAFTLDLPGTLTGPGRLRFRIMDGPSPDDVRPLPEEDSPLRPRPRFVLGQPRLVRPGRALAGGATERSGSGAMERPNLIVVSMDTLRADHLGCYGYKRDTTPNLDALAREALVFDQASSTSSWTLPAHISLLSGVHLGQAGGAFKQRSMHSGIPTLPERLKAAGYRTLALVGGGYVSAEFGMDRGFDAFDERNLEIARGWERLEPFLEARDGREPFFVLFHFFDIHSPFGDKTDDPDRFFREEGMPFDPVLAEKIRGGKAFAHIPSYDRDVTERERRHIINLYDADIAHADRVLGKLFARLRELGLWEDTALLLTSDHGEEFGEHGSWYHGKHLYREITRVPLLFKPPAGRRPEGLAPGSRIDRPVSLVDVAPTLTDLAGIEAPEVWQGASLLDVAGRPDAHARRQVLLENAILQQGRVVHFSGVLDGTHKFLRTYCNENPYPDGERGFYGGERVELYRMVEDPFERVNLRELTELRVLLGYRELVERLNREVEALRAGAYGGGAVKLSEETLEKLEALGYMK